MASVDRAAPCVTMPPALVPSASNTRLPVIDGQIVATRIDFDTPRTGSDRRGFGRGPIRSGQPSIPVIPEVAKDPLALRCEDRTTVREPLSWGTSKSRGTCVAVAAAREAAERGGPCLGADICLSEAGRKRFLTRHRENDDHPAFRPGGEPCFSSGASGQAGADARVASQADGAVRRLSGTTCPRRGRVPVGFLGAPSREPATGAQLDENPSPPEARRYRSSSPRLKGPETMTNRRAGGGLSWSA